jgi:hypothetical protein
MTIETVLTLAIAGYAAVVATVAASVQYLSWRRTPKPRVKVELDALLMVGKVDGMPDQRFYA